MKKELIFYSILTAVIALLLFFETDLFQDKTQYISQIVKVEAFEKLDIDLDCDIFVSLGEEQKIVFEGPANYLSKVKTSLDKGVLKISCKQSGLIAKLFNKETQAPESVKIYIKLTNTCQLIRPKKGNLISNEALQFTEISRSDFFSLNANLTTLLKLLGNQFGHIRFQ